MDDPVALPEHINLALNEATWFGLKLDEVRHRVALGFDALTLPDGEGGAGHVGVTLVLGGVTRLVASLRDGLWDDAEAPVIEVSAATYPAHVDSLGGRQIYGWEFFDLPEESWASWHSRLSFEARWSDRPSAHSLTIFKDSSPHLDSRFWFDTLTIYGTDQQRIELEDFANGGKRWWDGLYSGDERTQGSGIFPLSGDDTPPA